MKYLLFFSLLFSISLKASHLAGGDITYEYINQNQYKVIMTLYRDCSGIPLSNNAYIRIKSNTYNYNRLIRLTRDTSYQIYITCDTFTTCNGGYLMGIEKHIYSSIVTLPYVINDWVLDYEVCCRNSGTTNIQANNRNFYIHTKLNNTIQNNSPILTIEGIRYVCSNNMQTYNIGAFDVDGDSISYELVNTQYTHNGNIMYNLGYNVNCPIGTNPHGNLNFNQITGDLSFYPQPNQLALISILVKEYRNGILISTILRDIQIVTLNCNNDTPTIGDPTNIQSGIYYNGFIEVCAGSHLEFEIIVNDNDSETIIENIQQALPNANITIQYSNPSIILVSAPISISTNPYSTFFVEVNDNTCPLNSIITRGFNIRILDCTILNENKYR